MGTGLTVQVAGLTLGGTDAGDYSISQPTATANITPAPVTVTGITANNKPYDGGPTATLAGTGTLHGLIRNDANTVTLVQTSEEGTFASPGVGMGIPVQVSGLTLIGTDSGDYSITQPMTAANITPVPLTVTGITASGKVYDGGTTATLAGTGALVGVIGNDVVTLVQTSEVGTFASSGVGTGIPVQVSGLALSGTDSGDYTLTQPSPTATISTATPTFSGLTASQTIAYGTATINVYGTLSSPTASLVGQDVTITVNSVPTTTAVVGGGRPVHGHHPHGDAAGLDHGVHDHLRLRGGHQLRYGQRQLDDGDGEQDDADVQRADRIADDRLRHGDDQRGGHAEQPDGEPCRPGRDDHDQLGGDDGGGGGGRLVHGRDRHGDAAGLGHAVHDRLQLRGGRQLQPGQRQHDDGDGDGEQAEADAADHDDAHLQCPSQCLRSVGDVHGDRRPLVGHGHADGHGDLRRHWHPLYRRHRHPQLGRCHLQHQHSDGQRQPALDHGGL